MAEKKVKDILAEHGIVFQEKEGASLKDVAKDLGPFAQLLQVSWITIFFEPMRDFFAYFGFKSRVSDLVPFNEPFDKVLVSVARAIREQKLSVREVADTTFGGAYFDIALPATITSSEGSMTIFIRERPEGILIDIEASVPGQIHAGGRLTMAVGNLKRSIGEYMALPI